jgi:cell division protease FtsH
LTDQPADQQPSGDAPIGTRRAGSPPPTHGGKVQSGLAQKRNPVLEGVKGFASGVVRFFTKDLFTTFLIVASIVLTVAFFVLLDDLEPSSKGRQVALSEVFALSESNGIATANLLDQDDRVEVVARDGEELWASYPGSGAQTQTLLRALDGSNAIVTVDQQAFKPTQTIIVQFLIPIVLLVCLFALFTRIGADGGAGGIASFSNSGAKGRKKGKGTAHQVTFDDIAGVPEAVAELREIRDYLADPGKYLALGAAAPKGVLLVGPPGTGKTLLAKAVAGEADATFYSMSGSDFVESLVGVGAARVRDLFAKARKTSPAIIFIDEFDAAGRKRGAGVGQGNDEREQTLNQLLVEMDGFGGDTSLVVMGATNRPDILDPALLRPGRFDRQVTVDTPDVHGRHAILKLHGSKRPLGADVQLEEIARLTPGFSGAELANVVNEAALLTVRGGRRDIDQKTLEEAIDRVVAGPAKPHTLSDHEKWLIAVHESSHAVVTQALDVAAVARKVSIVARGRTLGTAAHMLTDKDRVIMQESDLRAQLIAILAGSAGEKLEFGQLSTGVNDDLHEVTSLARSMVTSFGMSEALGMTTAGEKPGEVFLGAQMAELGSIGPSTLDLIDREVARIVEEAELAAEEILRRNWNTVQETAQSLVAQETLSGVALDALLSTVQRVDVRDLPRPDGNGNGRRRLSAGGTEHEA